MEGGYIEDSDSFEEYYDGREDIPEEYKVLAYPKERSILETLKAFRENPLPEATGRLAPALAYAER